jgi:hypothetical protein
MVTVIKYTLVGEITIKNLLERGAYNFNFNNVKNFKLDEIDSIIYILPKKGIFDIIG